MSVTNPFNPGIPPAVPVAMSSGTTDDTPDNDTLYQFEGKNVYTTAAQITSVAGLEIDDNILRVDEYVSLEVECRVVAVRHVANLTTGKLSRLHILKAVDSTLKPWQPSNTP